MKVAARGRKRIGARLVAFSIHFEVFMHHALTRVSPTALTVQNRFEIPATLFANPNIHIERKAVAELLELLEVQATLRGLDEYPDHARLEHVVLTPDFHKASRIPVGTVLQTRGFALPQAIGNDVNCGMRLHKTLWRSADLEPHIKLLEKRLRALFFEAGRNIPMTGLQRQAMLQHGLLGLLESVPKSQTQGLWRFFHQQHADLDHVEQCGSVETNSILAGAENFIGDPNRLSRDAQIGSLGGGNHFAEIQRVVKILEPHTARAWGLFADQIVVMVHAGSLGLGHLAGGQVRQMAKDHFPKHLPHPQNGLYPMPLSADWLDPLGNAANFAFSNRTFLALMLRQALEETLGETEFPLLYDAPHNWLWLESDGTVLHRKGATPARGFAEMQNTPFAHHGEPVLIPGAMGASSFVMVGTGNPEALSSASHGAGRIRSRGEAMRDHEAEFRAFLERYSVITPLDWRAPSVQSRPDIVREHLAMLRQEAPFAYKGIGDVIQTQTQAQMVRGVVELEPILTVKG
jgi:tRNA-splicing ligase RtcB (3'-phosphate/5'-hydroxy nucleic acid ligase)